MFPKENQNVEITKNNKKSLKLELKLLQRLSNYIFCKKRFNKT